MWDRFFSMSIQDNKNTASRGPSLLQSSGPREAIFLLSWILIEISVNGRGASIVMLIATNKNKREGKPQNVSANYSGGGRLSRLRILFNDHGRAHSKYRIRSTPIDSDTDSTLSDFHSIRFK